MRNYLQHKSIKIILAALFFAVGVGAFALVASATITYQYSATDTYTNTTLLNVLKSQADKDKFTAFPTDYHRDEVTRAVNESLGTSGTNRSRYEGTVSYGNAWNKAKKGLMEWEAFEATKKWVDEYKNPLTNVITYAHYEWNESLRPNKSTSYGIQNPNPYTSLSAAQTGEVTAYNNLVSADAAYINAINGTAKEAITDQINKAKADEIIAANELAEQKYNACMAAAPAKAAANGTFVADEKLACDEAKALAVKEGYAAGEALAQQIMASSTVVTIDVTSTPGTSSSGGPAGLTPAQQAQAAALLANQEMASPKELELLASLKAGCYKINPLSMNCLAQIPYYFIYTPASWLLIIAGYMFDASLALSIDKDFINQPFVLESWTVIRDFSNMLFIFILLFTGIQTILGMGDWRKTVLHIVIIALLINFSLFFTKVVIDAGNILAVGVFQAIGTEKNDLDKLVKKVTGGVPERNISGALVASFSPQKFLEKTGKVNEWNALIVFLIAAAVNAVAAYVLFKVALVFIGRLLAFWVLMILSPFAFISFTLKGDANIFGWYTSTLISQAFVAPVFLFLLYLVMTVISAGDGIMSAFAK